MRIHHLQHVAFEGLGSIEPHLIAKGHQLSATHLYQGQPLPELHTFDWLIIMGGPMGIDDEREYPWMAAEKHFIRRAIDAGKIVLGICLGAQMIAHVMGAKVYPNGVRETGWFPIQPTPEADTTTMANIITEHCTAFHWHGDTFELPAGATLIASSEVCQHQGFILEDRVLALQCHLETTEASAAALIQHGRHELDGSRYVQSEDDMLANPQQFTAIHGIMGKILDALEAQSEK